MTTTKVLSATALVFLLATAAYARARQEHQEQPKTQEHEQPAKQEHQQPEHQQPEAKPQARPEAKPQQHAQQQPQPKTQQEQKPAEQQHSQPQAKSQPNAQHQQQVKTQPNAQRQQQTAANHAPQRTQQDIARQHSQPALRLSARGNGRIPDDRFHQNFGNEHRFRIGTPVMVGGYSRFQYGGYWFGFVQPWPVGWYYTDDVYVDYVDGGYYMYNPYHPGARFAISVVL
jgi:glucan-binding YG repeat protein